MIAPAAPYIDHDLGVSTTIESELIFSIFLLAFVIGPLFLAPLSEVYGRVIVLQLANVVGNSCHQPEKKSMLIVVPTVVPRLQSRLRLCSKHR